MFGPLEGQTLAFINRLQEEQDRNEGTWIQRKKPAQNCSDVKCAKVFGIFVGARYCRRCGNCFCKDCLVGERRLNIHGELDPNGVLQKVCAKCFDDGEQTIGPSRSHFHLFLQFRVHAACNNNPGLNQKNSIKISNFRENLDLDVECQRLRRGFKESLKSSIFDVTLPDLQVPAWKKSTYWVYGNMATKCNGCSEEFGLLRSRHNCLVCGCVICGECSTKDLLVYIPDGKDPQSDDVDAELAIIRIVGCPEKEPRVCSYLRLCQRCNTRLQDRQVSKVQNAKKSTQENEDENPALQMTKTSDQLTAIKTAIEDSLLKYSELVYLFDVGPRRSPRRGLVPKNSMQVLAKTQGDLADRITSLVTIAMGLKHLKPATQKQLKILRNLLQSSFDSYHDFKDRFQELQKLLENVVPKEILVEIQAVVNRNAINSCYLSVKQLGLEVLYLSDKHNLDVELLPKLIAAEEIVQEELRIALNEDWEEQEKLINRFLDDQLKHRRLMRPSRRHLHRYGNAHVLAVIHERSETILHQMFFQLQAKSTDAVFFRTKETLKQLHSSLVQLTNNLAS